MILKDVADILARQDNREYRVFSEDLFKLLATFEKELTALIEKDIKQAEKEFEDYGKEYFPPFNNTSHKNIE